ncbi:MAG: DNA polymerase IV [Desulfovibrionales bacterium]
MHPPSSSENRRPRTIMHLDMDAFFASIEQADDPSLKGRPVIVGNSPRGVVSAASYEARKFGVHSAMPVARARSLCPKGVFLPGRGKRYREVSRTIMSILDDLSPLVEKASVDEAYVDLTGTELLHGSSHEVALLVKARIMKSTGLSCSIGIAPNKLLAKIASDWEKPGGITIVPIDGVQDFLNRVPVSRLPGVGQRTGEVLRKFGIKMLPDILRYPLEFWESSLGKQGLSLYRKAQGIDSSPVVTDWEPKSSGAENTFEQDTWDRSILERWILRQAERVGRHLREDGVKGRTVTLKLKFDNFQTITKRLTLHRATNCTTTISQAGLDLLRQVALPRKVRLIGLTVSNFSKKQQQLLLTGEDQDKCLSRLDSALDAIQRKFGDDAITRALLKDFLK